MKKAFQDHCQESFYQTPDGVESDSDDDYFTIIDDSIVSKETQLNDLILKTSLERIGCFALALH